MKKILILAAIVLSSCATTNKSVMVPEDEFHITRKFIGNFVEYRHTAPERLGDPHIIWIKTTQDSTYGKITAYSRKCEFSPDDRLYLRRVFVTPGMWGYWVYQIENDAKKPIFYEISEFQFEDKILAQSWY